DIESGIPQPALDAALAAGLASLGGLNFNDDDLFNDNTQQLGDVTTTPPPLLFAGTPDPIQLARAQSELETALVRLHQSQLRVEQLPQYPRPNDLAAAQLALIQAQEAVSAADGKLEQLRARPRPPEIAAATAAVNVAEAH